MIYLKGSSGSGKSTLMKKVAQAFEDKGAAVDYIHCSNDATGLDGICVRAYGVSIVDATAPHICDPEVVGAIDEIVNLAQFLDVDALSEQAGALLALQKAKKPYYETAYLLEHAAYQLQQINIQIRTRARDEAALARLIAQEEATLALPFGERLGRNRRMFAAAVTPQGLVNYLDTLVDGYDVIEVASEEGAGGAQLLARLQQTANAHGFDTETCYRPWNITQAEHLFIPALNRCYLTRHTYCASVKPPLRRIDCNALCDAHVLRAQETQMQENQVLFEQLLARAVASMAAQKEVHDQIEQRYIAQMDFARLDACTQQLIARLMKLEKREEAR